MDKDIIKDIFLGLLRRVPTDEELNIYTNMLKEGSVKKVIEDILKTNEFNRAYLEGYDPFNLPHPFYYLNKKLDLFVHIPKVAGSSLRTMLAKVFGEDYVSPQFVHLSSKPFSWISKYSILFGHFDYDEAKYLIPSKNTRLFSFLRDPIKRLLSFYYFFKAHDTDKFFVFKYPEIVNRYSLKEFFKDKDLIYDLWLFNDMTRYIMGQSIWEDWKISYEKLKNQDINNFLEYEVRPIIKQRLKEYTFIGFQEDFERSSRLLFDVFGAYFPGVLEENITEGQNWFFKKIQKEPIEEDTLIYLNDISTFDKVLYDEAKTFYEDYISKISTIDIPFLIDFRKSGNANKFIIKGFYETEDWGSWTSEEGILTFNIKNVPKELHIRMRFNVFNHQQVKFYLNDFLFFVKTYEDEYVDVVFDISYLVKSQNTLKIKCPNAKSPKALNISKDYRTLGIGLIDIEIY